MKSLLERMSEKGIDRRSFLAMSAASVAALGLTGCSNGLSETKQDDKAAMPVTESEWKSAACWSHCGGRCALKALVEDGVITRIKTDDTHEDSFEWPQRRACLRGRSRRKDVYSADRLKYPMKRKGWQPGGGESVSKFFPGESRIFADIKARCSVVLLRIERREGISRDPSGQWYHAIVRRCGTFYKKKD